MNIKITPNKKKKPDCNKYKIKTKDDKKRRNPKKSKSRPNIETKKLYKVNFENKILQKNAILPLSVDDLKNSTQNLTKNKNQSYSM
jgi:hypothetical protein